MKPSTALWIVGAATLTTGWTGLQVNLAAERVATCEVAVNKRTLDFMTTLHWESRRAVDLAELRLAKRFYHLAGKEQPEVERQLEQMSLSLLQTNQMVSRANEAIKALVEKACDSERDAWIGWSLLLTFLAAAASCLGVLIGIRVAPGQAAKPSVDDDQATVRG